KLENYEQAISFFDECSKFRVADNNFVDEAMLKIAESHLKLNNYYKALFRAKDVLDICPENQQKAKNIARTAISHIRFIEKSTCKEVNKILYSYMNGNYEKVLKKLNADNTQSKLFLAKSHASLNHYEKAKSLYESIITESDKDSSQLAESEFAQLNRKFFLYAYTHFFDSKYEESIKEFEFLKSNITPKEEVAEKLSFLLMYAYDAVEKKDEAISEANYFLKNFSDTEYVKYVNDFLKEKKIKK
ncbi:MAG: hypothetical protein KKA79_09340, partial [Nanoarchaeota archaeon]|nr:hypothetical protein [Nanoarchaeota archaeon]